MKPDAVPDEETYPVCTKSLVSLVETLERLDRRRNEIALPASCRRV